jgi:isoleucyl-tRNA synthetase
MDVWFDSGSSHAAVLETRPELGSPADMYLEGSDQHRGWFQSSLLTSVATRNRAPYRQVLTHGYVVDGQGRKMSKSIGNGIDPLDVCKQYGADILRLWVATSDYKTDIRVSNDILKQTAESYRKIRNTARFLLGNIPDFNPAADAVPHSEMPDVDRWAMMRLNMMMETVANAYGDYDFHTMSHAIHQFCVVDMSSFYLDVTKDRMYASRADSFERRSGQTVMHAILDTLVRLLAPVLPFTCEEIWQYMPHAPGDNADSIQLNNWPVPHPEWSDETLADRWDKMLDVRAAVLKALEEARNRKEIGQSLQAKVLLAASGATFDLLLENIQQLPTVFICSQVEVLPGDGPVVVSILPADGEKCERCWNYSPSVGKDAEHPTLCARCADTVR